MTDATYTHLALVLDRSGSMWGIAQDMNGGVASLLTEQAEQPGKILVDVTLFDDKIEHPYFDAKPEDIEHPLIKPSGATALFDAVGSTITNLGERLAKLSEDERPAKVIFVIVTDGHENASVDWKKDALLEAVKRQQDEWNWEFVFLGANIDAADVGGGFGIAKGNTMGYAANADGVAVAAATASAYVTRSRLGDATSLQDATSK